MNTLFINYALAFIEGFALILSPCILPILPIILAGALSGGTRRVLGIMSGFVITFAGFTLFSRFLVEYLQINLDLVREFAYGFIILFGIILFSDYLSEKFSRFTSRIANIGARYDTTTTSPGFFSGFLLGVFTSLIWVPCGGPILAAAIIQTAVQATTLQSFFTFLAFALGSIVPMMIIAFAGNKIITKLHVLKKHTLLLRKFFAVIIILGAAAAAFYDLSPRYSIMPTAPNVMIEKDIPTTKSGTLINALDVPYAAPPITTRDLWINSGPLTLSDLRGKVVLIDFWTYSCINCVRTLPYLKSWYSQYARYGLVIIGVHTPEFAFERDFNNVKAAVEKDGIQYPVVLDNDYIIWRNYNNQYWPAHYLIDKNGKVVYQHFGEGEYAQTEHNIRVLLGLNSTTSTSAEKKSEYAQTPETYLGYARAENFYNNQSLVPDQMMDYQFNPNLPLNGWSLDGKWTVKSDRIIAEEKNASIELNFNAGKVYAVMGSVTGTPISVQVLINGHLGKTIPVQQPTLYELADLGKVSEAHLELVTEESGVELYTFTFGD